MKHTIFLLLLLLPCIGFSQPADKQNPESLDTRLLDFKLKRSAKADIKFPFSKISILDYRYDTSKIGFCTALSWWNGKTRLYEKVMLREGLQSSLENYYNEYYSNSFTTSSLSLLIIIKKLWLINSTVMSQGSDSYGKGLINYPTIKFEYYLIDDSTNYYPVKRIDTVYKYAEYLTKNIISRDLYILSYALTASIESIDFNKYVPLSKSRLKKRTLQDIISFSRSGIDKPILTSDKYKAGVYMSFAEFLNNSPSQQIENLDLLENYWGYSDGTSIYIYYHHKKLYKCGNTFEYFIDKVQAFGNDIFSSDGNRPRIKAIATPVQLDMETGKPYQ